MREVVDELVVLVLELELVFEVVEVVEDEVEVEVFNEIVVAAQ